MPGPVLVVKAAVGQDFDVKDRDQAHLGHHVAVLLHVRCQVLGDLGERCLEIYSACGLSGSTNVALRQCHDCSLRIANRAGRATNARKKRIGLIVPTPIVHYCTDYNERRSMHRLC